MITLVIRVHPFCPCHPCSRNLCNLWAKILVVPVIWSTSEIMSNAAKKLISGKLNSVNSKRSTVNQTLKWLFAILFAVIVLALTIKLIPRRASS